MLKCEARYLHLVNWAVVRRSGKALRIRRVALSRFASFYADAAMQMRYFTGIASVTILAEELLTD